MEDPEAHLFQTRKGHRIEQMVVRWLRRSRDSSTRRRTSVGDSPSTGSNQYACSLKIRLDIKKDLHLDSFGFDISHNLPLTITAVTAGGPAEGKLLPGDQIFAINNENVENLHVQKVADMVRDSGDTVTITVLRGTLSPKSSFLTAEKRARLKSNPVKVRFAEEVIVNGHTQGNSLLFMPNVLKVYLENGQTKAFKFERKTTVKDILMTLKEKLSINVIEHFALALEEQYNISKLYILYEDELIEQVVQKRESHDYRCLFRVCFVPKDPLDLLQEDPVAFEYLYLQSCSDVLQERFAVEMKCSVALRLAALHIQERIHSCGQPQKITFKYIEKDWGIDNFLSPTLLRNMRGKDIKKAISFHMKRNQCILEPRQKPISAAQVRLQYLKILGDLKTYGGKIFNATLMLQDRESYVTLLVGAKYGISQIINNKLNIMITLAEFSNISRIELTAESEKVSMVKVYLQDVKPLSLLLESNSAKDIACLISGYCKLFVSTTTAIFEWPGNNLYHRISTEEGYESRACSDSEESSELDSSQDLSSDLHFLKSRNIKPLQEEDEEEDGEDGCDIKQNEEKKESEVKQKDHSDGTVNDTDSISENSDSANTESQGYKISWSSDSIDALEEDDLETCSSSKPEFFQFYAPILKDVSAEDQGVFTDDPEQKFKGNVCHEQDPLLCFLQQINTREDTATDLMETSRSPRSPKNTGSKEDNDLQGFFGCQFTENNVMEYYSLCSNVSPASSVDRNIPSSPESTCVQDQISEAKLWNKSYQLETNKEVETLILDPPPGFGDSSSEEEFFDATDRFTPTQNSPGSKLENKFFYAGRKVLHSSHADLDENSTKINKPMKYTRKPTKMIRKRRSFLQTDYTTQVTFPVSPSDSLETIDHVCCFEKEPHHPEESHSPTVSSFKDIEGEPALLETKSLVQNNSTGKCKSKAHSPSLMEMEPDTMETKSVTDSVLSSISAIRFRNDSGTTERRPNDNPSCATTDFNIEHNGQASPSEISLEIGNGMNENTLFCLLSTDNKKENKINCLKEPAKAENSEENIKDIFKNIFLNDDDMNIKEDIGSVPTISPTDRMLPYIAKSEDTKSLVYNIGSVDTATSEEEMNSKESSPKMCKTRKLFGFSSAADLLLDFKGLADLFTFREGTSTIPNVPSCEEEIHLLTNQEQDQFTLDDLPSMIRMSDGKKQFSRPCGTSVDTIKFDCGESKEEIESDAVKLSPKEGYSGHLTYKDQSLLEGRFAGSTNKAFVSNEKEVIENEYQNYDSVKKKSKISKVGSCSCQLSYTTCFQPTDNDIEDEIIDFTRSDSPLPRTIPPSSGSSWFVKNNHNPKDNTRNNTSCIEHFEALDLLERRIQDSPTGFGKLQDSVLDLQKILEDYKDRLEMHPKDKCASMFSEQKTNLCNVSRKMMSSSQKVLRSGQLSEEIYQAVEETFFGLMQMTQVCLKFSSCVGCNKRQMDLQTNLRDLICTYHQFVQAAKKASESENRDMHSKLLSRQCTALTAAIFCLTQQFRSLVSL
ncbi:FERM and PDZ domain-containing protein 1 isoform X3 [Hyla sarda]|uniref:FERM and PDZ domain-containing protein 1 isoform X3 n=1 Tax=Hyla sarda TaxID=327740 RepID=UPI0024C2812A|nr:FERM and PDZ domain-containing protein 1 isoform X3 [Hyla sarda]